jgi:hypothetical protein
MNNLGDLINLAASGVQNDEIDNKMLYRILPQIMDINDMIGMDKLKQTIFSQLIYYLQELHDNSDYLHTIIMGPPGCGKCLGADVEILMFDGLVRKSQDIVVGDVLMGDDSTPRIVTSVCTGTDQLYRIGDVHDNFIVNSEHMLTLLTDPAADEAIDISVRDILEDDIGIYFTFKNKVFFEREYNLQIDPYVLGYCVFNSELEQVGEYYIQITDKFILQYFAMYPELLEPLSQSTTNTHYKLNKEYFKGYECIFMTNKQFPSDIIFCKHSALFSLLSGIIDSAQKTQQPQSPEFTTLVLSNKILIKQIQRICNTVGITNSMVVDRVSFSTRVNKYQSNLYKLKIGSMELPSLCRPTKFFINALNVARPWHHNVRLLEISKAEGNDYYGFEITGNGRFMLADSTVTHNTTIARLIGEMYKNLGILSPDGLFVTAKREDLVAEYLGQTAIKTKKLLQECNGGVLFIDEVYALGPGKKDQDSFSKEAIDTLNVYLSENKNTFCCIIAGYEEDIKNCFFSVNKGLERRFQWCHQIDIYSIENLSSIFLKLINDSEWSTNIAVKDLVVLLTANNKLFKFSGGDMEKLFSTTKLAHAKRIFGCKAAVKRLLTKEDMTLGVQMYKDNCLEKSETPVFNSMFI